MSNLVVNGCTINPDYIPPASVSIDGNLIVNGFIKSLSSGFEKLTDGDVIVITLNPKSCPELASVEGVEYLSKYCEYIQKMFPNNQVIGVPHFIDIGIIKKEEKIQSLEGDRIEDLPF